MGQDEGSGKENIGIEMVASNLKEKSDKALKPLAKSLARTGITPNMLTLIGLAIMIIACYFLYIGEFIIGAVIILASGFVDMLDGLVARHTKKSSKLGGFLDSIVDRISDMLIFGSVIVGGYVLDFFGMPGLFWGLAALTGALLTSYARSLSEANGVSMKGRGLVERPERIIIFCLALLTGYLTEGIVILAVLGYFTVAQRVFVFYKANKN